MLVALLADALLIMLVRSLPDSLRNDADSQSRFHSKWGRENCIVWCVNVTATYLSDLISYRLIMVVIALAFSATVHADRVELVEATWRVQHLEFDYHSAHSRYSCEGLEIKIRSILQAIGTHESLVVEAGCSPGELVILARVSVALAAPVEATDEGIVRAAAASEAHELPAARLPTAANIERFTASWQRVSLTQLHLDRGDCDLLRQLRAQILPKLGVRNATGFDCSVSATRLRPSPRVEALIRSGPPRRRQTIDGTWNKV